MQDGSDKPRRNPYTRLVTRVECWLQTHNRHGSSLSVVSVPSRVCGVVDLPVGGRLDRSGSSDDTTVFPISRGRAGGLVILPAASGCGSGSVIVVGNVDVLVSNPVLLSLGTSGTAVTLLLAEECLVRQLATRRAKYNLPDAAGDLRPISGSTQSSFIFLGTFLEG
jgi:hypothetical protein